MTDTLIELPPTALQIPASHPEASLAPLLLVVTPFADSSEPLVEHALRQFSGEEQAWILESAFRPEAPVFRQQRTKAWVYLGSLRLIVEACGRRQSVACRVLPDPPSERLQRVIAALAVLRYPLSWVSEALAVRQLCDLAGLDAALPEADGEARGLPLRRRDRDLLRALRTLSALGLPYSTVEHRVVAAIGPELAELDREYALQLLDAAALERYSVHKLEELVRHRLQALGRPPRSRRRDGGGRAGATTPDPFPAVAASARRS